MIPLLAAAWLLTVKPASAQYPGGSGYPGSGTNTGGVSDGPSSGPGGQNNSGSGSGSNTGYPGSNTGSNTGYPGGGTSGSNTGSSTGYPGGGTDGVNTGGAGTGGSNTGYPGGGTDGGNTGGAGTGGGPVVPGHWTVSYSSQGTTSWHSLGPNKTVQPGSRPWDTTSTGDGISDGTYLDAKTKGTVTATMTWVPTTGEDATSDPPASSVIVTENGNAGASGVGTADDGWGDPFSQGYTYSAGTHYEVKDGTSGSITITKTVSAATADNTTPDANGDFSHLGASVFANFNVSPPPPGSNTITLTGTSTDTDGTQKALTGQGVKAELSLSGAPVTITSYKWSFTGGTPIKGWDYSWPKWPPSSNPTQIVPLTDADTTGTDTTGNGISVAAISFYDPKKEDLTVTCTVKFTLPDGTASSATVKSPNISYLKPKVKWIVGVSFNGIQPGFFPNQPQGAFSANEIWGPITITEPPPFAGKGYGTGSLVQIATLGRSWTRIPTNNKPPTYSKIQILSADGSTKMVAKPTGLDVGCPYPYGYSPNGDPNNPDPTNWALSLSNYTWPTSTKGYSIDAPFQPYVIADQDNGGSDWRTSTASDSFNTWVMYEPPSKDGMGTIPVPLQKLKWAWGGTATLNTSTRLWAVQQSPQFEPGSPHDIDEYPAWTQSIPFRPAVGP